MDAFEEYPKFKYQGMVATYVTSRAEEDALEGVYTDAPVHPDDVQAEPVEAPRRGPDRPRKEA
jgi:hypothetical protein